MSETQELEIREGERLTQNLRTFLESSPDAEGRKQTITIHDDPENHSLGGGRALYLRGDDGSELARIDMYGSSFSDPYSVNIHAKTPEVVTALQTLFSSRKYSFGTTHMYGDHVPNKGQKLQDDHTPDGIASREQKAKLDNAMVFMQDLTGELAKQRFVSATVKESSRVPATRIGKAYDILTKVPFRRSRRVARVEVLTGWGVPGTTIEVMEYDPRVVGAVDNLFPARRDAYTFERALITGKHVEVGQDMMGGRKQRLLLATRGFG
ncbi:MAG: hypothetical protein ABIH92_05305 [Nanoarchaeota archaeon]